MLQEKILDLEKRLYPYINKTNGCCEWNRSTSKDGYGQISFLGKKISAHRASWLVSKGPIPEKLFVLHRCDNRKCVNPDHLFIGTSADNMNDMVKKGRYKGSKRRESLKPKQVVEIKNLLKNKEFSQKRIAEMFSVIRQTITAINTGQTWSKM